MLKITKYYKTISLGFIQSNFSSQEEARISLDNISNPDIKNAFSGNNLDKIMEYLSTLDSNQDTTITFNEIKNPELKKLFKKLGIQENGIRLSELKDKLNEYKLKVVETNGVVQTETQSLKITINTNIFKKTLKEGMHGGDVMMLQQFLVSKNLLEERRPSGKTNIDGKFGGDTKKALIKYQETIYQKGNKFADGVLSLGGKTLKAIINENSDGRFNTESATAAEVIKVSEEATKIIDDDIKKQKLSNAFLAAFEAREDGGKRGAIFSDIGSILGWIREIFGENNASEYFDKLKIKGKFEGAFDRVNDPKMQERFNKGYEYLVQDSSTRNRSLALYGLRDLLMVIFAGIPLFDVRLNFAKRLEKSRVDMNRAKLFTEWSQSGMKQSFEEYEKKNGNPIDSEKNMDKVLDKLRATASAYIRTHHPDKLKNGKVTDEVIKKLLETDRELQKRIIYSIQNVSVDDFKTLLSGGFNVFEYFFDTKYDDIKDKIDILKGGEIKIKNKARKRVSAYYGKSTQDVFLLKNNGKFYLHIGTEYKQLTKNLTPKEIESLTSNNSKAGTPKEIEKAIEQYNHLGLTTHLRPQSTRITEVNNSYLTESQLKIKAKNKQKEVTGWYREGKDFTNNNEVFISKKAQFKIQHEALDLFVKQNIESGGKLDGFIKPVRERVEYNEILNKKNSKFLKEAIRILKAGKDIPKEVGENFGLINKFNSTADFLNAYSGLPDDVKNEIKKLDHSKLTPEDYVANLKTLTETKRINEALIAIKSGTEAYKIYRKKELYKRAEQVSPKDRVDAGKFKYGAMMISKEDFKLLFVQLKQKYQKIYNDLLASDKISPKDKKKLKQEFKNAKSFKYIYTFDKPNTGNLDADYKKFIYLLSKTGPNIKYEEESGKYLSSMDLAERGLIEQGIFDITGEQLYTAIADRGEDVPIESLFKDPGDFINTARQAGTKHDIPTTFKDLAEQRGDQYVKYVKIDRSYNFVNKDGENVKIDINYDVYDRPECQNVYVLPNSKSIQRTITTLKQNNNTFLLGTSSFTIALFNIFAKAGITSSNPGSSTVAGAGGTQAPGANPLAIG